MAGKGAPPLFDLISESKKAPPAPPERSPALADAPAPDRVAPAPGINGSARPAARPAPAPEPKPAAREPAAPEPVDVEQPQLPPGPRIDPKKTFSIPVSVLYVVVPVALVGLLIAFSAGFTLGEKNRDKQLQPYLEDDDAGPVIDPLLRPADEGADPSPDRSVVGRSPESVSPGPPRAEAQRTPASAVTKDSRQLDHNYLLIASRLDGEQAIKAAVYLTGQGVPALAFDPSGGVSKDRWELYSLLGFHSDNFREQWKRRADHKARIEALCSEMQPEDGGPIDASTAYWDKFDP